METPVEGAALNIKIHVNEFVDDAQHFYATNRKPIVKLLSQIAILKATMDLLFPEPRHCHDEYAATYGYLLPYLSLVLLIAGPMLFFKARKLPDVKSAHYENADRRPLSATLLRQSSAPNTVQKAELLRAVNGVSDGSPDELLRVQPPVD
jgi:hypothetical protein